jgi:hypothetical protein
VGLEAGNRHSDCPCAAISTEEINVWPRMKRGSNTDQCRQEEGFVARQRRAEEGSATTRAALCSTNLGTHRAEFRRGLIRV